MRWHIKRTKWFMVQWGEPIFFSLGIHIDPRRKYVDLHLIFAIITIGDSGEWEDYEARVAWWASQSNVAVKH